jgi:hypothetical protein
VFGCSEYEGIFLDYSRQQATGETMEKLLKLADVTPLSPFLFVSFCVWGLRLPVVIWDLFGLL